jgi:tRNA1Val (adenine37-N6)-methyltransferase
MNFEFRLKGIRIVYDDRVMKPGVDSVLLGAVASAEKFKRAIDLGCGSGIMSLMLSLSNKAAHIAGVDIDPASVEISLNNYEINSDLGAVEFYCCNMFEMDDSHWGSYDLVISNPPYYINQLNSANTHRSLQRHWGSADLVNFSDLCSSLLMKEGKLMLVLPVLFEKMWTLEMMKKGLFLQSEIKLRHHKYAPFSLSVLTYGRTLEYYKIDYLDMFDENGKYSGNYRRLCGQFILDDLEVSKNDIAIF